MATIKYSSAGVRLWTRRSKEPGTGYDYGFALAVDSSGDVFVQGSPGDGRSATVAYSSAGVPLWTNRFDGDLSNIAVNRDDNVFVTEYSSDAMKKTDW